MNKTGKIKGLCMIGVLSIVVCTAGCSDLEQLLEENSSAQVQSAATLAEVPEYSGDPYVEINDNQPEFEDYELTTEAFEEYSELDELGRCGTAEACVGEETMPTEERGNISSVKPTGWKNKDYDNVDGGRLYNRCHLIGFQLTGENANEKNLITGTRYMNTEGMLPFENMVADYVHETDNHVLYRVTPIFDGDDLVASGVQMEAESVEDDGAGVCFNVYVYNVQPQITINYATGDNWESDTVESDKDLSEYDETDRLEDPEGSWAEEEQTYILNVNSHKFHLPECSGAKDMKEQNKREFTGTRSELIEEGYEPCGSCNP
ncbi:MAG TPA: DNA/RNA non-specific endonuclease [Candidatus Mediterraneibacter guildfordensis]|jgi:DNA-entry nuclease|nr:DNA/RNA non-specific endonuclease [Candidatus Mediterraneibacter guildfordensis]